MAFNTKNTGPTFGEDEVALNAKGTLAVKKSPEQVLFEGAVSCFYGKDTYHNKADVNLARINDALKAVVTKGNFEFLFNLVNYARNVMGMRSMPIYIAVQTLKLAHDTNKTNPYGRRMIESVIQRADALTEVYALSLEIFGKKNSIPLAIKRGVGSAFNRFNEYAFGKYKAEGKAVWLRDALRMSHPKPKDAMQAALYKAIKDDTLKVPDTWEVLFTQNGQKPEKERMAPVDIWRYLLDTNKLGYLATIRNLRKMGEQGIFNDKQVTTLVCDIIRSEKAIHKSKVFPFQLYLAYKIAKYRKLGNAVLGALTDAIELSLDNIPDFGDNVWIILDTSGSMTSNIWVQARPGQVIDYNERLNTMEIAAMFVAAMFKKAGKLNNNIQVTGFSDTAKHLNLNPGSALVDVANHIVSLARSGGTVIESALALKPTLRFEPDTVFVFSDMEVDRTYGQAYGRVMNNADPYMLKRFKKRALKVAFNFNQSETTPASEKCGWTQLSGYSDKVFQLLEYQKEGVVAGIVQMLEKHYEPEVKIVEVQESE